MDADGKMDYESGGECRYKRNVGGSVSSNLTIDHAPYGDGAQPVGLINQMIDPF